MDDTMLLNIEYLRGKADVTYEEAAALLEANDGSVIKVLMVLEQQDRLYTQRPEEDTKEKTEDWQDETREAGEKAKSFVKRIAASRLIVEKDSADGKKTIVNLGMPIAVGAAVLAPYLAMVSVIAGACTGCSIRVDDSINKSDD